MKSKKGPIMLIFAGILLVSGPIWGLLGTVIGMFRTFETLENSGSGTSERLASDISTSLVATTIGLLVSPIGLILLIVGIVWLVKIGKSEKASNQTKEAIASSAAEPAQPHR